MTKGSKIHKQLGRWHALNNNYAELKKYGQIEKYIKGWLQGRAEERLKLFLEYGPLTAQQQFQLNHKKAYEHYNKITNPKN